MDRQQAAPLWSISHEPTYANWHWRLRTRPRLAFDADDGPDWWAVSRVRVRLMRQHNDHSISRRYIHSPCGQREYTIRKEHREVNEEETIPSTLLNHLGANPSSTTWHRQSLVYFIDEGLPTTTCLYRRFRPKNQLGQFTFGQRRRRASRVGSG